MSDAAAVVLALSAAGGAFAARTLPMLPALTAVAFALLVRRPAVLWVATALLASALAARALTGLSPPLLGGR